MSEYLTGYRAGFDDAFELIENHLTDAYSHPSAWVMLTDKFAIRFSPGSGLEFKKLEDNNPLGGK